MRTFPELISDAVGRGGDRIIYCPDGNVTYADLEIEIRKVAAGLGELGVGPGDRVGFWLPNLRAYLGLLGACGQLGAIAVAMNTRFRKTEIEDMLRRSQPKVVAFVPVLGRNNYLEILNSIDSQLLKDVNGIIQCGGNDILDVSMIPNIYSYKEISESTPKNNSLASPDSGFCIFTTSGTTSLPKFVLHNHEQVVRHAGDVAKILEMKKPGTMIMQSLPFCGVFGFVFLASALRAAAPMVMSTIFEAADSAETILRYNVTHCAGGDDMFSRILEEGDRLTDGAEMPFPSLKFCPYASFNSALAKFPKTAYRRGLPLVAPFGMSEVFSFFSLRQMDDPESVRTEGGGFPVNPMARVRVRDPNSGQLVGHNHQGELEVFSPNMFVGYYRNDEATRGALTNDGFLRTGDLGTTSADGSFNYIGRMGDVLRLGGFLVNPLEIETHLCSHFSVSDAQVVALATDRGNRPFAFVIPNADAQFDEKILIRYCKEHLASFKVPVRVIPIERFPTTPSPNSTKIQKGELRRMASQKLGA